MTPDPNATDLKSFITYRLARLQSRLNAQAIRMLKTASNLSLTEWRIVAVTALHDTCTLSDLVRDTGLDKGQLSRAVSALVSNGYLVSAVNQDDQRQNLLHLSASGTELHAKLLPIMRGRQEHLLHGIDPHELATALKVLDALDLAAGSLPSGVA